MRGLLVVLPACVLAVISTAVPANADAAIHFTVNQQFPLAGFQVDVPCTGDTITFTQGSLHDLFSLTVNGSHYSFTTHDQPSNLKGTDAAGRSYEGVGITREHDAGSFVNGQAVSTFVNNFYMVGKAGAPSLKTHETFHVTFTPSGNITAFHDRLRVTCG
jgi:hypothetical protein